MWGYHTPSQKFCWQINQVFNFCWQICAILLLLSRTIKLPLLHLFSGTIVGYGCTYNQSKGHDFEKISMRAWPPNTSLSFLPNPPSLQLGVDIKFTLLSEFHCIAFLFTSNNLSCTPRKEMFSEWPCNIHRKTWKGNILATLLPLGIHSLAQ